MNSIAVTKPDMAVVRRDRLGLSLFGLLALAFGNEISTRSTWSAGWYRELPLDLLEQEEAASAVPTSSEPVQIKVDLKGMLDKLQKEHSSAPRMTPTEERILERVYLLEHRIERQTAIYPHMTVHLESISRLQQAGCYHYERNADSEKECSHPEKSKQMSRSGEALDRVGERLIRMVQNGMQLDRGRTAIRITQLESLGRLSAPLTPVVFSTAAPAEGGWAPRWQEDHPGFPQKGAQHDYAPVAGSILLPDLMRQRRKQAADDSENVALHAGEGMLHRTVAGEQAHNAVSASQRQDGMRELVRRLDRAIDQVIARSQTRSTEYQRAVSRQEEPVDQMQDDYLERDAAIRAINRSEAQTTGNRQTFVQLGKTPNEAVQDKMEQPDGAVHESRSATSVPRTDETAVAVPVKQTVHTAQNLGADGAGQMAHLIQYTDAALPTTEEELYHRQEQALETQQDSNMTIKTDVQLRTDAVSHPQSHNNPRAMQPVHPERATAEPVTGEELHYRQEALLQTHPDSSVVTKSHMEKQTHAGSIPEFNNNPRAMQSVYPERATIEQTPGTQPHLRSGNAMKMQPDSVTISETNVYLRADYASLTPFHRVSRAAQTVDKKHAEANPIASEELYYRQEASPEVQLDSDVAAKVHAQKQMNDVSHSVSREVLHTVQTTDKGRSAETVRTAQASDIRTPHYYNTTQRLPVGDVVDNKPSASHAVESGESERDVLQTERAVARPVEIAAVQHAEILQHRALLDESAAMPPVNGNQPTKQTAQPVAKRTVSPMTGHPVQAHRASPMRLYRASETTFRPIVSAQQVIGRTSRSSDEPTFPAFSGESLTYLPVQNGAAESLHATKADAAPHQNTAQLPDWAQRFLQQPMQPVSAAQQGSAMQYPAAVGAQPPAAQQIEWTAPNALPSSASIVYAEHKPQPAQSPQQAARLSDSELHRAADKVYRIIEERLRKELRRSGK